MTTYLATDYAPPTRVPQLLEMMIGSRVNTLTRYSWWPGNVAAKELPISRHDVFAYTAGPLLIDLGSEALIRVNSDDVEWGSVVLSEIRVSNGAQVANVAIWDNSDLYPVEACDDTYSDKEACDILGDTIASISVLQGTPNPSRPSWPCETAMCVIMASGRELVLCHGLRDGGADEFSVRTRSRVPPGYIESLTEVLRR